MGKNLITAVSASKSFNFKESTPFTSLGSLEYNVSYELHFHFSYKECGMFPIKKLMKAYELIISFVTKQKTFFK